MKSRTTSIELLRFIAAAAIMLFHFGNIYLNSHAYAAYGYIVVDFFFMLTGFFMMRYLSTEKSAMAPGFFFWHKIRSFYPVLLLALSCQLIFYTAQYNIQGLYGFIKTLFHFKWEFLLFHCAGILKDPAFNRDYLLGQDWYLSAMMLGLIFTYPLARCFRQFFENWLAPVTAVLFYGILVQYYGSLNVGSEYLGIFPVAIIRGAAGICLGSIAYSLWKILPEQISPSAYRLLSILEICLWFLILLLFSPGHFTSDTDSFFYILLFLGTIVLGMWNHTYLSHWCNTHAIQFLSLLGALSLYLYILHWTVMTAMITWLPGLPPQTALPLFFAITLLMAYLLHEIKHRLPSLIPLLTILCLFTAGVSCLLR